jgi:hypothetical protein
MDEQQQARALILFIGAGMKVLSMRIVLVLALLMTFGLFVWAMCLPTSERILAATVFTLLVFLPAIRADFKQNEGKHIQGE